ncbi:5-formyltetrahydrofolate cyclo-ligase [Glaciecola petra]|uniref:5-formyltetrahydrofolate cyclo-ligase n=1 Tax=Glaciecola petra TaxID=3075602 RepID=A0ABU2ZME7_9ALTE|nr:5-formyltetrahydrofolate cyclo-ligase [Aestuariibacter sp. P117]MDT0593529.1 5-formyltetrahydrofolate cyclo-ligase [Aestuariibacter sp. P117]
MSTENSSQRPSLEQQSHSRNSLRQHYINIRNSVSPKQQKEQALRLLECFQRNVMSPKLQKVALYITNKAELDTAPLISFLWQLNIDVYVPVLHPFCKGHLLFIRYAQTTPMTHNKYAIAEPILDVRNVIPLAELDTMLVPLVCFDEHGNRLGMGGGYYDRTLSAINKLSHKNKPQIELIGLAYDIQKALSLPNEKWDVPLTKVLTPSRLYRF